MGLTKQVQFFGPSMAVAVLGLVALGWLMLTGPATLQRGQFDRAGQIGVVFAPWSQGGLAAAAAFGAPIVALRWGEHLAILDASALPDLRADLQSRGFFVINTALPPNCFTQEATNA